MSPVEPERSPGAAQCPPGLSHGGLGESTLAENAGEASGLVGKLGCLVDEELERGIDRCPPVAEIGVGVPLDLGHRVRYDQDRLDAGGPEQPVVVLGVPTRELFVDRTPFGDGATPNQVR